MGGNGATNLMDLEDDNDAGAPCAANYEKIKNGDDGSDEDDVDPYDNRDDWLMIQSLNMFTYLNNIY